MLAEPSSETGFFWVDLSTAGLIDGNFPNGGAAMNNCNAGGEPNLTLAPGTLYVGDYFPSGKIGGGNFIYVYDYNAYNWYGLSAVTSLTGGTVSSASTIPVTQAYSIDKIIDDGLPTTGNVQAVFINGSQQFTASAPNAPNDTVFTCYNTTSNTYSIGATYGSNGLNCALSFRFQ